MLGSLLKEKSTGIDQIKIERNISHTHTHTMQLSDCFYVQTLGYWNSRYRNEKRESLQTCLNRYGWGVTQIFEENKPVRTLTLIYLDESRSDGHAWGLAIHQGIFFVKVVALERNNNVKYKLVRLPSEGGPPEHKRNFSVLKGLYPHIDFEEMPDLEEEGVSDEQPSSEAGEAA